MLENDFTASDAYRENCVLVNCEDTNYSVADRVSVKPTQKYVNLYGKSKRLHYSSYVSKIRIKSENDISTPSGISVPQQAVNAIPKYLLDGDLRKNFLDFHIFFLWFSITILFYTLILLMSQLETQQLMMSQIIGHT